KSALNKADECVEYNSIAEPVGDKRRIGDTELARTIYKISLDHADDFNNFKNIADSIVGEDSLRDKLWAKEVYQIALDNAENVCDLNELADSVANDRYLGDNDWAKNIYQIAINKAENTSELCSVAGSIAAKGNFADKSWAIEIYQSAAKVAGGYDDYLSVANGLADERKANEKNLAKPYYLTALEQSQDNEERADVISNIETTLKDKNWADELKQQRLNSCKNKRNVIGISISSSITAELADWFYRGDKSDKSKGYKLACESLNEFLNGLRGKLGELGDIFEEKLLIQLDGKLEETTFNIESLSGQIDTIKVFLVITKHVPSDMLNALFFDMKEDAFEAMFSIGDDDKIVCQSYSFGRAGEGYFSADQYRRESYINNFKAGGDYGWKNYPTASKLLLR
ncbi:MAG: hypothetical protein KAI17_24785, partial [Thiotrichaceae bacterium]|nr:hypothetical protein [Thiotrichaceae bacterium]